jgi:hypothetical protein
VIDAVAEQTSKGIRWRDIGLGDWLFDFDQEACRTRYPDGQLVCFSATYPVAPPVPRCNSVLVAMLHAALIALWCGLLPA